MTEDDSVLRCSPDGRSIWIRVGSDVPAVIDSLDLGTGRLDPIGKLAPADRAGLLTLFRVSLADDPGFYAYNYWRCFSSLFVIEGAC